MIPSCLHSADVRCRYCPVPREKFGFKVPFDVDDVVSYNRGVADERARITRRLWLALKGWGPDGAYDLQEELETGIPSAAINATEEGEKPFK